MKKLWWVLGLAAVLALAPAACGDDDEGNGGNGGTGGGEGGTGGGEGGTGGGEGGTGGGEGGTGGGEPQVIDVSGTVALNPIAAAYYAGGGTPPALETLIVRLVDPVKAKAGDPEAMLGQTSTILEDGSFTITDVDVSGLTLGMVVTVDDDEAAAEDDFFAASTMGVCQPAAACKQGNITDAKAYIVPMEVVAAIGTGTGLPDPLLSMERGFILGLALEPPATPLADVTIGVTGAPVEPLYLDDTFGVVEDATGTTDQGVFLFEHSDAIVTLEPTKADYDFMPATQQAGTTPGVVFQVFFVGMPSGG